MRNGVGGKIIVLMGCVVLSAVALLAAGIDARLDVVQYEFETPRWKAGDALRIAVVADYHGEPYGSELLDAIKAQRPDIVVIPGDMVHRNLPLENAYELARALAARYPTYFVTGNHDIASYARGQLIKIMLECGITVLEGAWSDVAVGGSTLRIVGIDDPLARRENQLSEVFERIQKKTGGEDGVLTLLLAHRPERIADYAEYPIDLVLAGHAHGGQWRIPGLLNGLIAPHQGLFPRYAGGRYDVPRTDGGETTMIVSRGLARTTTWVPRIYNRPELVLVEVRGTGE